MNKLITFLEENKIHFSKDKSALEKNSEDTSLFKIYPKIIIYPKNKFEISKLLSFINNEKTEKYTITSRSGGTDMSGGAIGNSIILSFSKYFNHIEKIDKENKFAIVEPGVYYRDFEKETLKSNLLLPSFPASREICAIGGMISNNSGGEKGLIYGKTENYILELEVVLSNGEMTIIKPLNKKEIENKLTILNPELLEHKIYKNIFELIQNEENKKIIERNRPKVSKNSAGYYLWNIEREINGEKYYDLTKIITGSQGTLAIVTKAKLSLITPKKYSKLLLILTKDLQSLGNIRKIVLKYNPESFESYDDSTFKVAIKFFPAFLSNIFSKQNNLNIFKFIRLGLSFWREAWTVLTFGTPKLFLLAEFTGDNENEIEKRILSCKDELDKNNKNINTRYIKTEFETEKYWTMRRESFNLLRQKVRGLHTAPFIDDIIVKGEDLGDFLNELIPILNKYKLFYTIAGHVGDGNLHIIPLMNFDDENKKAENIETIKSCGKEVYSLIKKYKGSITGEHNDGLVRTPYLLEMYDKEMIDLFRKVKNIFDENNILNPGKKVPINNNIEEEIKNNFEFVKFGKK